MKTRIEEEIPTDFTLEQPLSPSYVAYVSDMLLKELALLNEQENDNAQPSQEKVNASPLPYTAESYISNQQTSTLVLPSDSDPFNQSPAESYTSNQQTPILVSPGDSDPFNQLPADITPFNIHQVFMDDCENRPVEMINNNITNPARTSEDANDLFQQPSFPCQNHKRPAADDPFDQPYRPEKDKNIKKKKTSIHGFFNAARAPINNNSEPKQVLKIGRCKKYEFVFVENQQRFEYEIDPFIEPGTFLRRLYVMLEDEKLRVKRDTFELENDDNGNDKIFLTKTKLDQIENEFSHTNFHKQRFSEIFQRGYVNNVPYAVFS